MCLVWGRKGYSEFLGYMLFECSSYGWTGPFKVYQTKKKFTLNWIPTFSYDKQHIECGKCRAVFEVPITSKEEVAARLMSQEDLSRITREAGSNQATANQTNDSNEKDFGGKTKRCPYYAEVIQAAAVYCRFCKRELAES